MASSSTTAPSSSTPTLNLHFSPEWMRTTSTSKLSSPATGLHGPDSSLSPTTSAANAGGTSGLMTPAPSVSSVPQSSAASAPQALAYSSLLTPAPTAHPQSKLAPHASTDTDPFRYSRDAFLSIYRAGTTSNGGAGWRLGIEVERHDGVVVDVENIPACAKEMTEAEIKLYAMPSLNSRRPSLSHGHSHTARDGEPIGLGILGRRGTGGEGLSMGMPSSSSRNSLGSGGPASPLRERFSRRDSTGTTQPYRPRQLINTATAATTPGVDGTAPLISPRTVSGGFGFGGGPGFDGVLSAGEGWGGRRRGPAGPLTGPTTTRQGSFLRDIQEKAGDQADRQAPQDHPTTLDKSNGMLPNGDVPKDDGNGKSAEEPAFENWEDDPEIASVDAVSMNGMDNGTRHTNGGSASPKPPPNPAEIKWQYIDDQQITQGPFAPEDLTVWEKSGWLRPDLRMNRPDHDTLFLPLSTWKEKLNEAPHNGEDKGVFFTWFEPIHEKKPEPKKTIQPPPGLARHDIQSSQIDANIPAQRPADPPKLEAPAPPSVFEVLRRADHAPSPVFGDNGFSHSPVSSHRLSMKGTSATLDSTHTSSPASSTANINMYGDTEYVGVPRQPQIPFHQGMNYPLPAALARGLSSANGSSPLVGYSSPIASYSAGVGDLGPLGMQPPFSHSGMFTNNGMRKPSYEQYPMPNPSWQGNIQGHGHSHRGSNLVSGGTGVAATSSTTSSLSNVPRAHFGGRRSPSPAAGFPNGNSAGALTSTLGGEVCDGTLGGPAFHTAIGRTATGYSPQQQFGTLYRSPVPPIPEMGHGIEMGAGNPVDQPSTNDLYPQGHATVSIDPSTGLPRRPSVEPMSESWSELQQQSLQQQQEQRARLQHMEVEQSLSETQPQIEGEIQPSKGEKEKRTATSAAPEAAKPKAPAEVALATPKEEDENSQPFIPVKKQQRVPPVQTTEQSHVPLASVGISPSVSTPTISQTSSKITVPLASLITNPSPAGITPTTAPPAKAWATVVVKDEAKGLKEIQEAEARRAKENEKLKARAAPSAPIISPGGSSSTKDEELGTLLTWGLPTSLAGARAGKDAAANNASTPPAAVWTGAKTVGGTATSAAKRTTMKDIQEEEEKRKKKEREVVTAAKRVSEKTSTPLSAVTPTAVAGSAWSTVGASGKAARPSTGGSSNAATPTPAPTGIAALPPRPSAAAIAGSGMQAAHSNSTATNARPAAAQATRRPANAVTVSTANIKVTKPSTSDDAGVGSATSVSPDTLKWMRETLKGKLVKGITVEEVIGLVLMMHEEDDIADTIYQSSPTLPGKRFAAEFMERRRGLVSSAVSGQAASPSSALSARGGAGSAGSGAESASSRLQPSGTQDAFGFKVVKKKGKSAKA